MCVFVLEITSYCDKWSGLPGISGAELQGKNREQVKYLRRVLGRYHSKTGSIMDVLSDSVYNLDNEDIKLVGVGRVDGNKLLDYLFEQTYMVYEE